VHTGIRDTLWNRPFWQLSDLLDLDRGSGHTAYPRSTFQFSLKFEKLFVYIRTDIESTRKLDNSFGPYSSTGELWACFAVIEWRGYFQNWKPKKNNNTVWDSQCWLWRCNNNECKVNCHVPPTVQLMNVRIVILIWNNNGLFNGLGWFCSLFKAEPAQTKNHFIDKNVVLCKMPPETEAVFENGKYCITTSI